MSQNARDLFAKDAPLPVSTKPKPELKAVGGTLSEATYNASSIEVLEGLEPVRRRPGMYIGGTDEKALHHLFAEVIDNAMDEAVAGHASFIEVHLDADGSLTVSDNGRGIPVDKHPKFPDKSALEVILTTLHSGGKFDGKAYEVSGGLHGVGISVVNALSDRLEVEVARGGVLYKQSYSRGFATSELVEVGKVNNRRGTRMKFHPDPQIFGEEAHFHAPRLFKMARSKAYLFGGVEIRWSCAPEKSKGEVAEKEIFKFPGGLKDFLAASIEGGSMVHPDLFAGKVTKQGGHGSMEWAVGWVADQDGFVSSYCNTIPTGEGGTHEAGLRIALLRGLKDHAERTGNKKIKDVTTEDILQGCAVMLSIFIREPEFQGQTKDKLATVEATRIVDSTLKDHFDHWLAGNPKAADKLIEWCVERSEERLRRRAEKEVSRKSLVRKLRLPGKLSDCANNSAAGSELFIVEGDSAGGSAKQARNRQNQAILPLRGKILNVASSTKDKLAANQQLTDLVQALGCGTGSAYRDEDLRYEKVIIMTDADVDGAHIASLLLTFFYRQMPKLIDHGHLYLGVPPLYRLTQGSKTLYARDDAHKEELMKTAFKERGKIEIGRFKGLGEMMPAQLKETTMSPLKRTLLKVQVLPDDKPDTNSSVEKLMGVKAESRFIFISENAQFAKELDI